MISHRLAAAAVAAVFVTVCMGVPAFAADNAGERLLAESGVKGGLIVHVGCGGGQRTAKLLASPSYLVHGLDRDPANVAKARKHIRSLGLYGKVSIDRLTGRRLPYTDNLVNLVVAEDIAGIPMPEVMRVLAPGGAALVKRGQKWTKTVKPRPAGIDEWTHFLYNSSNNAVSKDRVVGPPHHVQWIGGPKFARSHEHFGTVSAAVSSGGRLFTIIDEGPTATVALPPRWSLIARDAFNGVVLWKKPVGPWENHLRFFRGGPPEIGRRLVAIGDRVYVTLGYGKPVSALDAATGKVVRVYKGTGGAYEILYDAGRLYLAVGDLDADAMAAVARRRGQGQAVPPAGNRRIVVVDAETGRTIWKKHDRDTADLMPAALAVDAEHVVFENLKEILCLDKKTGRELWRAKRPLARKRAAWSAPTLVLYKDVVLSADVYQTPGQKDEKRADPKKRRKRRGRPGQLIAFSAKTGKRLWSCKSFTGFNSPSDVFVANGLVWTGKIRSVLDPGFTAARDPMTGKVRKKRPADSWKDVRMPHHRCYRNRATERYLLLGRAGIEFLDTESGELLWNHWTRGTCQFGILPANGLVYAPPHACACYIEAKLSGFIAMAPLRTAKATADKRFEKGAAFGAVRQATIGAEDWPTFRHDPARSGRATTSVPADCRQAWRTRLGGRLSSPVIAGGRVFVASIDTHTVHALDASSGQALWSKTVGGRVDSPPTIHNGTLLFGSADGWVYCLRAADGKLVWRFRAAPEERRIVSRGQVESVWPVHGSVLVQNGSVSFAAGRSSFLDGGIRLYRLDAKTGEKLAETRVDSRDPKTGRQKHRAVVGFDLPGALPDVLSASGGHIFMRHRVYDDENLKPQPNTPHLFSPAGFLDDNWWHRTYWIVGNRMRSGFRDWADVGNKVPAGRILVVGGSVVYGYSRLYYDRATAGHVGLGRIGYHLFAADTTPGKKAKLPPRKPGAKPILAKLNYRWVHATPVLVRAMAVAGETLFIAGPPDLLDERSKRSIAALEGKRGGTLRAVSAASGKKLAELPLDSPPVFDGMAAAAGRLYLVCLDGTVRCYAGPKR